MKRLAALAVALALGACGFHLRGAATMPFNTIAVPGASQLIIDLQRNIASSSNAKVVPRNREPEAVLEILGEVRDKVILSLNTQGRVREYQLRYAVSLRVHNGRGGEYLAPITIPLRRDITFNDQVLAKESEEALLYREMQSDMVQQIMRRLQASKPPADEEE